MFLILLERQEEKKSCSGRGQVWFQNRRMKHKRQTVSKDDPEMKETKSKSESGRTGRRTSKRYDYKKVEIYEEETGYTSS
jgi:hypothetical protein